MMMALDSAVECVQKLTANWGKLLHRFKGQRSAMHQQAGAQLSGAGFHWFIGARMNMHRSSLTHTHNKRKLDRMLTSVHLCIRFLNMLNIVWMILFLNENMQMNVSIHIYYFRKSGYNTSMNYNLIFNFS